ncbi:MAG: amino acid permease [Bacteroidota bacterium]|nr:amino acid permease [Bacteroidota bacterium]MDP4237363.1 amino acid permease [Bacteroidota bacterium]
MATNTHLKRALTLYPATAIVIGSVVGSGIFTTPVDMANVLGNAPLLIAVWAVTGLITMFGALTQCELIGQMPRTGGLYEYFREIYGEKIGFLYGWANFMIAGSGAIAAIAVFFTKYFAEYVSLPHFSSVLEKQEWHIPLLGDIFPYDNIGAKGIAAIIIIILTAINIRGVKTGAFLQSISTTSKVIALLVVTGVAFVAGSHIGSIANWSGATEAGMSLSGWALIGAIGTAITGAFWSYDGWGNVAYIGGEIKEPAKTLPRAIILGTLIFTSLYVLINLAYLYILPIGKMGSVPDQRIASEMVTAVIGGAGGALVAGLIMLSAFDTTNSSILTNARVYFAMARDRVFAPSAAIVHPKFQTPHIALILQGAWSLVLVFSGSFNLILDMYVFVNWLLYVLMALGVFILRKRDPQRERPFKVPGYPVVPAIFVLFATSYLVVTLIKDINGYNSGSQPIISSLTGVALVLTGLPFYYFWKNKQKVERLDNE